MTIVKWTSREFNFNFPSEQFPVIIERLKNTYPSIKQLIETLSKEALIKKPDGAWSIQEHIGHLIDLEELHEGRIDDFLNHLPILRAADMTNKKTEDANHNQRDINELMEELKITRNNFISRLEKLKPTQSSMHPRLQKQMRVADLAFFVAEHDNHHLILIRQIANSH